MNTKESRLRRARQTRRRINVQKVTRLVVHRTNSHIYAQIIAADSVKVLTSASTLEADVRKDVKNGGNKAAATVIGKRIAERAKALGIDAVAFDSADDLLRALSPVPCLDTETPEPRFVFRGHSDANWELIPKALRLDRKTGRPEALLRIDRIDALFIKVSPAAAPSSASILGTSIRMPAYLLLPTAMNIRPLGRSFE